MINTFFVVFIVKMNMIKSNIFRKESAALSKAEELGCEGTHKHDGGFMPCKSHKEWEELTSKPEGEIDRPCFTYQRRSQPLGIWYADVHLQLISGPF